MNHAMRLAVTGLALAVPLTSLANIPPPPVNQRLGIPDGVFNTLEEADCRNCHEDPNIVLDALIPDRHHNRLGTVIADPTAAPNGTPGENYECLSCHSLVWNENSLSYVFAPFRDCAVCHEQTGGATVHHATTWAAERNCKRCHGSFVDNYDDGHYIPTYAASKVTPWPSGKTNSGPEGQGNCVFCHAAGTDGNTSYVVYSNMDTHHSTGLAAPPNSARCTWCHDPAAAAATKIRQCETCHGVASLHNIQFDANGNGVEPGNEEAYNGHIGNDLDCQGCHGFTSGASAPYAGPTTPSLEGLSAYSFVQGVDARLEVRGSGFRTNIFAPGSDTIQTVIDSKIALTGANGEVITLEPERIEPNLIVVKIPGTLTAQTYTVTAVKGPKGSNPTAIAVRPRMEITSARCGRSTVIIKGQGFSEFVKASNTSLGVTASFSRRGRDVTVKCRVKSWSDGEIVASCARTGRLTVTGIYGKDQITCN